MLYLLLNITNNIFMHLIYFLQHIFFCILMNIIKNFVKIKYFCMYFNERFFKFCKFLFFDKFEMEKKLKFSFFLLQELNSRTFLNVLNLIFNKIKKKIKNYFIDELLLAFFKHSIALFVICFLFCSLQVVKDGFLGLVMKYCALYLFFNNLT